MATYIIHSNERLYAQMARIEAESEREALLRFLILHPEMEDVMIWKSTRDSRWRVAPYDHEENFYYAELAAVSGATPWQVFCSLPINTIMRVVDTNGQTLLENYRESAFSDIDNMKVLNVERSELAGTVVYSVTVNG